MVEIFIDADACPVKAEVIKVAERHNIKINVASNSWHLFRNVNVEINQVMVEKKPDAADDWIAENVKKNDIVIASDIPLASRCLKAGAFVLRPNGKEFTDDNIGSALSGREINNFLREVGEKTGYNASFTARDKSNFLSSLEVVVQRAIRA